MNYRLDLAGSWGDHPFMSDLYDTHVICASIVPGDYNQKGGLSGSTRETVIKYNLTSRTVETARAAFILENLNKDKSKISGSQDAIGCVVPGIKHLTYSGDYWPTKIDEIQDKKIKAWLEKHVGLVYIKDKPKNLNVFLGRNPTAKNVKKYSDEVLECLDGIMEMDLKKFGESMTKSFRHLCDIMPSVIDEKIEREILKLQSDDLIGYKLAGSGGGGYLITVGKKPIGARIKIA